ncbi:hypothetical protein D9Q98_006162 [Chlorella vulgaris]|uniref:Uncharacterized protein n=1 Tax=Chlorella vulgaris TaxID=3077 RepID=A0A9D4TY59_CHLVU|nr:hypothetical protein D9Q98_006162 [Chlorella vulgaris]
MSDEYDAEEAVEKRASYVRDNLPAALPFEAPSYLVQHMELADNGKQISWPKAFFLVVGDSVSGASDSAHASMLPLCLRG